MTDDLVLRLATDDDHNDLGALLSAAFMDDVDDEATELYRLVSETGRTHVVTDSGAIVGTAATYTRELTVPGAVIPAAHVTGIAVVPTHTRRGLLRRLMSAQLAAAHERRESIAVLWASEGTIYGRFGYGVAARHVAYEINTAATQVPGRTQAGRLVQVDPADSVDDLASVYEQVRATRPGWSSRPANWWQFLVADLKSRREGLSRRRGVLYKVDGRVDGYALWRIKGGWSDAGPDGTLHVNEVVAASADAYQALWRFLLSIDLIRTVKAPFAAVDEPLAHVTTDPGAIVSTVAPSLWVRVLDVPAALSARRYAAPIDAVVEVTDDVYPQNAGRWQISGDAMSAVCKPSEADPDIELDAESLGAAYLGGASLQTLAAAGKVIERSPGALPAISTAFGWHQAPSAIEIF